MKDAHVVFEECLQDMIKLVGEPNLRGCFIIATDLTRSSALSDFKRGVFIAEILENVFVQVGSTFDKYVVSKDDEKEIIDNMTQNLSALLSDYKGDKVKLYDILEDLRFTATMFQIKYTTTGLAKDNPASAGRVDTP